MKHFLKEINAAGILFFYFLKWPYLLGFGYLYSDGMYKDNYILIALWFYCLALVIKDFIYLAKNGSRCKNQKK